MHLVRRRCEFGPSTSDPDTGDRTQPRDHPVNDIPAVHPEESSSDGDEDVEPKTDADLHDDGLASSSALRERGVKRRRFMSHPHHQKTRRGHWPSGTVISKNHIVRRSKSFGISKAFTDALAKLEDMSNESRNRQFHKLFSFIPTEETVIVSYSCALVKEIMFHGRMFISPNWICFHSNIFTFETQVAIKMTSIASISKARTAFVIPNAIGIQTENEKYVFGSLLSRRSTYMQLIKVWKNAVASTELEEEVSSSCTSNDCSGILPLDDSDVVQCLEVGIGLYSAHTCTMHRNGSCSI
ncbi:GRAM domain-containing protein 2B-like [Acanthaster planci]|uniref:GRAM domain-containing protein 2B-like n=1 Tax=Acanthaster planci TaxID=133434 RepID=A0A8B7ZJR7_ACAPL|nr:GRAM domain-containing protein 2B-like [Acanthaster planci]